MTLTLTQVYAYSEMEQMVLKRVELTAALGSAPLPSLPQPRPRAAHFILGSAPSRFEATSRPSNGPPKAATCAPTR